MLFDTLLASVARRSFDLIFHSFVYCRVGRLERQEIGAPKSNVEFRM